MARQRRMSSEDIRTLADATKAHQEEKAGFLDQLQRAQEDARTWELAAAACKKNLDAAIKERDAANKRAEAWELAAAKYWIAENACHIGLKLNDEYRERAEAAERDAVEQRAHPCYCCQDSCWPGCSCHDTVERDDSGNATPPAEAQARREGDDD